MTNPLILIFVLANTHFFAQQQDGYKPEYASVSIDTLSTDISEGYELLWSDEFNIEGKPDEKYWSYEEGFVRNEELHGIQRKMPALKMAHYIWKGKGKLSIMRNMLREAEVGDKTGK